MSCQYLSPTVVPVHVTVHTILETTEADADASSRRISAAGFWIFPWLALSISAEARLLCWSSRREVTSRTPRDGSFTNVKVAAKLLVVVWNCLHVICLALTND